MSIRKATAEKNCSEVILYGSAFFLTLVRLRAAIPYPQWAVFNKFASCPENDIILILKSLIYVAKKHILYVPLIMQQLAAWAGVGLVN
jgi:hypothetical protein